MYIIEVRITCVVNTAYTTREPVIFCSRISVCTDCVLLVAHQKIMMTITHLFQ